MMIPVNLLTGHCKSTLCKPDGLIDEQHRKMANDLPLLYFVVIISLTSYIIGFTEQEVGSKILMGFLLIFCAKRLHYWLNAHTSVKTKAQKKSDLIGVVIISPLISLFVSASTSGLIVLSTGNENNLLVLAIFVLVIVSSFALVPLPVASVLVVLFGTIPLIGRTIIFAEDPSFWLLLIIVLAASLSISLLISSFRSFAREITGKNELETKSQRALEAKEVISRLAFEDALTSLPNRRKFIALLTAAIEKSQKNEKRFAVGLLDIDHFKSINDLYGHNGGDEILKQLSERLTKAVGNAAQIARMGGDEFSILFYESLSITQVSQIADNIHQSIEAPFTVYQNELLLSISLGITNSSRSNSSIEILLSQADQALYLAKKNGRSKTEIFTSDLESLNRKNSEMTQALRLAVRADQIEVEFQPIVNIANGKYHSCESLARWFRPEFGQISPDIFIEVAEQNGMIEELTFNLLRKSALAAQNWPNNIRLNFNLSAYLLKDAEISSKILKTIAKCGLPPNRLEIEITETALVENLEKARTTLRILKNEGVYIALDDFGTGYSSLGQLGELPIDKLKIDKCFVDLIATDQKKHSLIKTIYSICENFEIQCVAEGIETEEQLNMLLEMGGTLGQGYLFSKPMPVENLLPSKLSEDAFYYAA